MSGGGNEQLWNCCGKNWDGRYEDLGPERAQIAYPSVMDGELVYELSPEK
jgi:hypothetical protein